MLQKYKELGDSQKMLRFFLKKLYVQCSTMRTSALFMKTFSTISANIINAIMSYVTPYCKKDVGNIENVSYIIDGGHTKDDIDNSTHSCEAEIIEERIA